MTLKTRSVHVLGGGSFSADTLTKDVTGWTKEKVTNTLREVAVEITQEQVSAGNTPSSVMVDNSSFKKIDQAEKKVVVLFGVALAQMVIRAVEDALEAAIEFSTDKRTGALANINNWQWIFVPGAGKGSAGPVNPMDIKAMGLDDRLILRPKISYATAANNRVAGGSRAISYKMGAKAAANARLARKNTNQGFLGAAANLLRRNSSIRANFSVYASFSPFTAPGEVATMGGVKRTGQLILRPRKRGRL